MTRPRFATLGDNCVDVIEGRDGTVRLVGGNALNVAAWARACGVTADYFGAVGEDDAAGTVLEAARRRGVGTQHVVRDGARSTSITRLRVSETGDRIIVHEDFGACGAFLPAGPMLEALATYDHVHIGYLPDGGDVAAALAAAGVSVSRDFGVTSGEGLPATPIAFTSAAGGLADAHAAARRLLAGGAYLAVATAGAGGSVAATREETAEGRALPVEIVDTTGAGDAFIAGFLTARFTGAPVAKAQACGHAVAALACARHGGLPAPP